MKKILIFTDSRGQHIPRGYNFEIFPYRIKKEVEDVEVDMILCPMKWTTTMDFFEFAEKNDLSKYDYIILYTGIVEWSPRPQSSAINDLYNNKSAINLDNWFLNTRDYSKKIINNKKYIFDKLFGEENMKNYLNSPFDVYYECEATINMLSLEMAHIVGKKLSEMKNLIYINANRIVPGWEGDYKRGRPKNISIIHKYCDIVSSYIPSDRLIDLREWSNKEIMEFTCDNMHLTDKGSNWIFNKLIKKLNLKLKDKKKMIVEYFDNQLEKDIDKLLKFKPIERFNKEKVKKFIQQYTDKKYLATLIIGVRFNNDPIRNYNLEFLLKWLNYYYADMFDILIVEQDKEPRFDKKYLNKYSNVRYEFIYNDGNYNRGWGYNVAVKHFCKNTKVIVMMDTDVLTGSNFVPDIRDCLIGKYKVISPYQNIYYTEPDEVEKIFNNFDISHLNNKNNIKNPVTITGGIVIFDKKTFLELKGYEQYTGYCCEDRALDTLILEFLKKEEIKISPYTYIHLYHPTDKKNRSNFDEIYKHLVENYNCKYEPNLKPTDFIHKYCNHSDMRKLTEILIDIDKEKDFGNINLYKDNKELTINGRIKIENEKFTKNIILPPEFKDFDYSKRELYEAPSADVEQLKAFRNKFLGERCFIIGNGPSLNKHDLSLLENEYTFGVNSIFYKTEETGFRPTFYVVEDTSVMKENIEKIRNYSVPFKFFPTIYKRLHPKDPNTFFFTMNRGFYEKSSPNYCVPRFSTDVTKEIFCGQSVTYINLQLAYYMGFTEIYLIGMDFNYVIPKSHKRIGDVLISDTDDPNHFHKDYFGKGKSWKDPKLDRVAINYKMAKLVFESTGRKIYNATIGGKLEIFERVDYFSLFNLKREKQKNNIHNLSFSDANKFYLEKKYYDALKIYLSLIDKEPHCAVYKQALFNCYFKAKASNEYIPEELVQQIKSLI